MKNLALIVTILAVFVDTQVSAFPVTPSTVYISSTPVATVSAISASANSTNEKWNIFHPPSPSGPSGSPPPHPWALKAQNDTANASIEKRSTNFTNDALNVNITNKALNVNMTEIKQNGVLDSIIGGTLNQPSPPPPPGPQLGSQGPHPWALKALNRTTVESTLISPAETAASPNTF